MGEKIVNTTGVDLCTETFGITGNPAVLLISGANASMMWWDTDFCQKLADKGRFVIRYDNRDVGKSKTYEPGNPGYTIVEMVDDAAGVLKAYHIDKAHIVGMSLGGMIAQLMALRYPDKVLSLTLMSTAIFGPDRSDPPPSKKEILEHRASAAHINWLDKASVVKYLVDGWRLLSGSKPFDELKAVKKAGIEFDRAKNLQSMYNHSKLTGGDEYINQIKNIAVPTLVVHGTEDPVLPYAYGASLAEEIPTATLLTLTGSGHENHYDDWDAIIEGIARLSEIRTFH